MFYPKKYCYTKSSRFGYCQLSTWHLVCTSCYAQCVNLDNLLVTDVTKDGSNWSKSCSWSRFSVLRPLQQKLFCTIKLFKEFEDEWERQWTRLSCTKLWPFHVIFSAWRSEWLSLEIRMAQLVSQLPFHLLSQLLSQLMFQLLSHILSHLLSQLVSQLPFHLLSQLLFHCLSQLLSQLPFHLLS